MSWGYSDRMEVKVRIEVMVTGTVACIWENCTIIIVQMMHIVGIEAKIMITVVKLEREEEVDVIVKRFKGNCNVIIEAKKNVDRCWEQKVKGMMSRINICSR